VTPCMSTERKPDEGARPTAEQESARAPGFESRPEIGATKNEDERQRQEPQSRLDGRERPSTFLQVERQVEELREHRG